jgi:hypothetical protein
VAASELKVTYKNFEAPKPRPAGRFIEGDAATQSRQLAKLLHEEAKVI